jgi:[acyl-carrier-protein] S-malonyltransferase
MKSALEPFRTALGEVELREPSVPILSGMTARPIDAIADRLAESLISPVRWREVLVALFAMGVRDFLETGPGKVLTGFVRRTLDEVEARSGDAPVAAVAL